MRDPQNRQWDNHRQSTAPAERGSGQLEKRVFFGLVVVLGALSLGLEKACSADKGDDKSIEYVQPVEQHLHPQELLAQDERVGAPTPEVSPVHIPLQFIAEFAPVTA